MFLLKPSYLSMKFQTSKPTTKTRVKSSAPEISGAQNRVNGGKCLSCNYSLYVQVRQSCANKDLGG